MELGTRIEELRTRSLKKATGGRGEYGTEEER